jgi:tetratricopeptide (TPR) repeat protein
VALLFSPPLACTARRPAPSSDAATRIRYYDARVREHPRLYPAYTQLGAAYLDQARATLDPAALRHARAALTRSLEIQASFEALKTMTALCNFTHRFAEALEWGRQAALASPGDTEVTALRVEAHLGLGERDAAAALIAATGAREDFHLVVARARWLAESDRTAEAAAAFTGAAEVAHRSGVDELVVWAEVSAAGVWLDADQPDGAVAHLDRAARLRPDDRRLRVHRAELLAARGDHEAALVLYRADLRDVDDPEVHRRVALILRDLGRRRDAEVHFGAAERGFRRALDAGEVYTLEGLALLYAEHRVRRSEAIMLSGRNLAYKRDRSALATDALVRATQ